MFLLFESLLFMAPYKACRAQELPTDFDATHLYNIEVERYYM